MDFWNSKDLSRRTDSDKILHDKAFNIGKNPKYDGYQRGLATIVYKFLDKKSDSLAWSEPLASRYKSASGILLKMKIF